MTDEQTTYTAEAIALIQDHGIRPNRGPAIWYNPSPCPTCSSPDVRLADYDDGPDGLLFFIDCKSCPEVGEFKPSVEEACDAWNAMPRGDYNG